MIKSIKIAIIWWINENYGWMGVDLTISKVYNIIVALHERFEGRLQEDDDQTHHNNTG
jgi:hypothetical protein